MSAYAFCESVYAGPTSLEHIRVVGPEGLKLGGGVPNPALCGRDLHGGWDIRPVTAARVTVMAGDLCLTCAHAWRKADRGGTT